MVTEICVVRPLLCLSSEAVLEIGDKMLFGKLLQPTENPSQRFCSKRKANRLGDSWKEDTGAFTFKDTGAIAFFHDRGK